MVRYLNRYVGSLFLAAALAAPAVIMAGPQTQESNVHVRVCDRNHRDYHNWDDREDRAYQRYLDDQHGSYREWMATV